MTGFQPDEAEAPRPVAPQRARQDRGEHCDTRARRQPRLVEEHADDGRPRQRAAKMLERMPFGRVVVDASAHIADVPDQQVEIQGIARAARRNRPLAQQLPGHFAAPEHAECVVQRGRQGAARDGLRAHLATREPPAQRLGHGQLESARRWQRDRRHPGIALERADAGAQPGRRRLDCCGSLRGERTREVAHDGRRRLRRLRRGQWHALPGLPPEVEFPGHLGARVEQTVVPVCRGRPAEALARCR